VRRGHLDVTLHYELGPAAVGVNREVAAAYLDAVNQLRRDFEIEQKQDLAAILRLPGVIGPAAASLEDKLAEIEAAVTKCLVESLDKLDKMRADEANALRVEMSERLRTIAELATKTEAIAERAHGAFAKRLELRLKELLGEAQLDPARLAQEAAIAAERSDVSEEITRLRSTDNSKRCWPMRATSARSSIFFCRKCSAKRTRCSRKLPATKRKGSKSRGSRSKSNPRSKSCASRFRTSNERPRAARPDRLGAFWLGEVHAGGKDSGAARDDAIDFVHYAAAAQDGRRRQMVQFRY
jgi:hypothetical protein